MQNSLASLAAEARQQFIDGLTREERAVLAFHWPAWARPSQLPPAGDWSFWMLLGGRGAGKTRAGAEWVRQKVAEGAQRIALIGPTAADARDVMVHGESGIIAIAPQWDRPLYEPSKRRVVWQNGAQAFLYSAEEPDRLRGPQHDAAPVLGPGNLPGRREPAGLGLLACLVILVHVDEVGDFGRRCELFAAVHRHCHPASG